MKKKAGSNCRQLSLIKTNSDMQHFFKFLGNQNTGNRTAFID